ncbi:MAG: aldehyde dehydrogenase family protein [Candidatus Sumerlaeia bacterium]|nr:aldehyde dehydrogenase family protein [Candidatus Sumerlaeia bacterium]
MEFKDNPGGAKYGRTLVMAGHLIDGQITSPKGAKRIKSTNPAFLDDVVGEFPEASAAEVEDACKAAAKAFKQWRLTPAPVRGEFIAKVGQLLREKKEELSRILTREIGKPLREARGEVQEAIDTAAFFQSEGRRLYGQTVPSELRNKELETFRKPLGVCALITASNFPVAVPSWKIIPAILCGNTVVWKPSQDAQAVAMAFANIFIAAGLPAGVVNVVFGRGSTSGQYLVDCIDKGLVQKVSFTGSTEIGMRIGEVAGRNLQIPSLELGGKNPMIVMDDADIDLAVTGAIFSGFGTGGQRCTSLGNLILHEKIADKFVEKFVAMAKDLKIGDPSYNEDITYGPLITQKFVDSYLEHHAIAAKSVTAKCLLKGERINKGNAPAKFCGDAEKGLYVTPTIYDHVKIGDEIAQTEVFGPTVTIIRVKDIDEAIATANGTKYGLSSAIYTNDPKNRHKFKRDIGAGMSSINNTTNGAEAHLPFGGTGWSGNGTRESGIWVIDAYTRWHCVNIDDSGGLQLAQMDVEEAKGTQAGDMSPLVPKG